MVTVSYNSQSHTKGEGTRAKGEERLGIRGLSGRRPNGYLGLSLNDRTILFLVTLSDKTVSVG